MKNNYKNIYVIREFAKKKRLKAAKTISGK